MRSKRTKPIKSCFQKDFISKKHASIGSVGHHLDVTLWLIKSKKPHQMDKNTRKYASMLYIYIYVHLYTHIYNFTYSLTAFKNREDKNQWIFCCFEAWHSFTMPASFRHRSHVTRAVQISARSWALLYRKYANAKNSCLN